MFEVVAQGEGPLFMDPDADKAREFFRGKKRALVNKVMSVKAAVERYVHDGDYLGIGGFGANRIPTAVCHEIVRQRKKNLAFAGHTATHDFQILAAGEVFNRCDIAYIIGLEARGLSPNARRYMESGKVQYCEWTNYGIAIRLKAAAMGVSFLPGRSLLGTDTFKYSAAKAAKCPFTGQMYCLFPALFPDVAAIHVHGADVYGNVRVKGISVADFELVRAAKHVIVTCERLIRNEEIRNDPTSTYIPYYLVDAVCEVPYGSYPGNMAYEYFSDEEHLKLWMETEKDPAQFKKFLDKYIYGTKDFDEYLELCGGIKRINELRAQENLIELETRC
ncbi:MAG: CoA transferase subunit A [Deltaproteobacteria bacterium]|nr:CoA transferase subunit A [Deltaproteobacteria bacterium]